MNLIDSDACNLYFMQKDWIKVYRSLLQKGFYKKSEHVHLWLHLLLKAGHGEKEIMWNGKLIKLTPGQFITGRNALSSETGINSSKVERILKFFETEQQIEQQKTTKFRLVTLTKWSEYQKNEQKIEQQLNNKRTTTEQQLNTNKKVKNIKKEKNILSPNGDDEKNFNFLEKIGLMVKDPDRRMKIIAYYWQQKGMTFLTKESYESALKRELKPSVDLKGYDAEKIKKTISWLKENADFKWTLETVHKYIDEPLENLAKGGKQKTEDDEIEELRKKYAKN